MKIALVNYTHQAKELLIFSKNTRHLDHSVQFQDVIDLPQEKKDEEIEYVFGTISSSLEFVDYTFLIQDVTRAFTHQLVRHRIGTAVAQQSLRVASAEDFRYLVPDTIEADSYLLAIYENTMSEIQQGHKMLTDKDAPTQDARGVLPTNICTNILFKINLRALSALLESRLCVRAQKEFQDVALKLRELVLNIHPWTAPAIAGPLCVTKGICQFPRFDGCPISRENPMLVPTKIHLDLVAGSWANAMGFSPQPRQSK